MEKERVRGERGRERERERERESTRRVVVDLQDEKAEDRPANFRVCAEQYLLRSILVLRLKSPLALVCANGFRRFA